MLGYTKWLTIALGLGFGLLACAGPSALPTGSGQSDELASLRQQVSAQGTRLAALETRVALAPSAGAQVKAATPVPAPPTATIVPPVTGLGVDGTTKGAATAKVTITEWIDFL